MQGELTRSLLGLIASNSTDNGILLARETVDATLGPILGTSSVVLGLAGGVLFTAGLSPRLSAGHVSDGFDGGALDGVELSGGLAARQPS
jgi:hypothetical protein